MRIRIFLCSWILFVLRYLGRCRVSCLGQAEHFSKREPGIYMLFAAAKNHSWGLRVVVLAVGGHISRVNPGSSRTCIYYNIHYYNNRAREDKDKFTPTKHLTPGEFPSPVRNTGVVFRVWVGGGGVRGGYRGEPEPSTPHEQLAAPGFPSGCPSGTQQRPSLGRSELNPRSSDQVQSAASATHAARCSQACARTARVVRA